MLRNYPFLFLSDHRNAPDPTLEIEEDPTINRTLHVTDCTAASQVACVISDACCMFISCYRLLRYNRVSAHSQVISNRMSSDNSQARFLRVIVLADIPKEPDRLNRDHEPLNETISLTIQLESG
jgi:hypothetical protein